MKKSIAKLAVISGILMQAIGLSQSHAVDLGDLPVELLLKISRNSPDVKSAARLGSVNHYLKAVNPLRELLNSNSDVELDLSSASAKQVQSIISDTSLFKNYFKNSNIRNLSLTCEQALEIYDHLPESLTRLKINGLCGKILVSGDDEGEVAESLNNLTVISSDKSPPRYGAIALRPTGLSPRGIDNNQKLDSVKGWISISAEILRPSVFHRFWRNSSDIRFFVYERERIGELLSKVNSLPNLKTLDLTEFDFNTGSFNTGNFVTGWDRSSFDNSLEILVP